MTHLETPSSAVSARSVPRKVASSAHVPSSTSNNKFIATDIIGDPQAILDFLISILESSTEYSLICQDLTGKILLWGEGARRLYGYAPDETVGHHSSILHTQEALKAKLPQRMMEAALRDGKFEDTLSRKRKNGEQFSTHAVLTPLRKPSGKPFGFLLISRDTSDEVRTAHYVRSLIEASLDPLVAISPDGKITDVNEATTKVTGVSRENLIGTDFSSYFTEPDKAQEGYRRVFAEGLVTDYPLTIRHLGGQLTNVLYNASVYRSERGNVLGVFAAARDVTAQRQAEARLAEQHGRELERLAELEKFQRLTIGRELRMIELKKEIDELKKKTAEVANC